MVISLFYHLGYPGSFNISEENGIDRRILLISIDTLRQDFVGTYGNQKINTPNIDGLADDSIVYLDAVSQAPYTWPSLSSLLTGRFTFRHGVRMNGQKLKDSELSLSEILFMHGFETSFLTDIGVGGLGLEQGFKHNLEKEKGLTEFEPFRRILTFIPGFSWWFQGGPDSSLPMTLEALRWLRKNAKKNSWFLWIHYYNDSPHEPYTSPEPYKSMYVDPEYHGSMTGNLEELVSLTMNRSSVSEADRNQLIALYMGEITWMDYQVGLILKLLKQTDLYSKTNIILTSDHGQMFGRMGNYQHSYYLYDSLLRVPLIIKPDENFTKTHHLDPEKKRISGLVRLLDLHPTILELAGINSDNNSKIDGQSLLPLAGNNSVPASSRLNYSETLKYGIHNPKNTGSDLELCLGFSMISSDGWKLIHVMDQNQDYLYNRISDPGESLNVSVQNPEKVKDLTQKILTLLNIQNLDSLTPKEIELPDETLKESLRALGYVH